MKYLTDDKLNPRIYVACLASYNNGILHGAWIDADQCDEETLKLEINAMLAASPIPNAEEYAIHDHEGFGGATVGEYMGIDEIRRLAAFVAENGRLGVTVLQYFGGDVDEAHETLEDRYLGSFESLADYAQEVTEQTIDITEALRFYIDYERMARDMAINDVIVIEISFDQVHVFLSR
jgi:antirestriction protein